MTIAIDSNKVNYTGNGVTTIFPFSFRVDNIVDLQVYLYDIAANTYTLLTYAVDYTVSGVPGAGSVTYNPAGVPLPLTKKLYLVRKVPILQGLDINNQGGFFPESVEAALDTIVMGMQQLEENLARAVTSALGSVGYVLPAALASAVIGWNASATALENKTLMSLGVAAVVDDPTLAGLSHVDVPSQYAVKTYVDTSLAAFGVQPTFTSGGQWSSANYGASLITSGVRNNAIAMLDSVGANPWAIANVAGVFTVSKMPALGNIVTAPTVIFALDTAGDLGTGNPFLPQYQIGPIKTKLGMAGVFNDSVSGNIFQISSSVSNSGTAPAVAGFFMGEATGAGSRAWGINVTAFANNATAVVDAIEIDFASIVVGGFANGALIVYDSTIADTAGAYVWAQANHGKAPLIGFNLATNGGFAPLQTGGTVFKTTGAFTVTNGVDLTSVTISGQAFRSPGFFVDGSGNVNGAAGFLPVVVGGTGAASSLSLRSTTGVGTTDCIKFQVGNAGATESFRIDTTGNLLKGYSVAVGVGAAGTTIPGMQVHGSGAESQAGIYRWVASTAGPVLALFKSRGAAAGTRGIVQSGDTIGSIQFYGDDGANAPPGAAILALVDGVPGVGDMPGRLQFSTTADGASVVSERMRIDSNGFVSVLGGSFGRAAPSIKTADFTVAITENWLINNKAGSTCTVTLPSAVLFPGREIMFVNYQAFTVVSASANVIPLIVAAAGTAILAATIGKTATLVSDGTNWRVTEAN